MRSIALAGLVLAGPANAHNVIFDTFNEDDASNLFDCCHDWLISGRNSIGGRHTVAVPFTPLADTQVLEVDVALNWVSGRGRQMTVTIYTDANGRPGKVWSGFGVSGNFPPPGQCCKFMVVDFQRVPLTGGTPYWIGVTAKLKRSGGWNFNSLSLQGSMAVIGEDQASQSSLEEPAKRWNLEVGVLPAIRIIGQ